MSDEHGAVGLGAEIDDNGANQVRLHSVVPIANGGFRATAAAAVGFNGNWSLTAFARCAPRPAGYEVVPITTSPTSSAQFKQAVAPCPGTKRAIGSGASIQASGGEREVGLQMFRTSGPMDIVRATAREDADGYSGNWVITAYAICVDPVPGQAPSPGGLSFGSPVSSAGCPTGTFVHGFGGGGSTTDVTGPVWLNRVQASSTTVTVTFTGIPGDGLVAQAICAN